MMTFRRRVSLMLIACLLVTGLFAGRAIASGYIGIEGGIGVATLSRDAKDRIVNSLADQVMENREQLLAAALASGMVDTLAVRAGLISASDDLGELSGSLEKNAMFARIYGGYSINHWSALEIGVFRTGNFNGSVAVNGGPIDGFSIPGLIRTQGVDATLRIQLGVLFLRLGGHHSAVDARVGSELIGGEIRQTLSGTGMLGGFGVSLPLTRQLSGTLAAAGYQGLGGESGLNYAVATAGIQLRF